MLYFSKNWKIKEIFFPGKFTPLKFDHSPVLKKPIKKEKTKETKRRNKERKKESVFKLQVN